MGSWAIDVMAEGGLLLWLDWSFSFAACFWAVDCGSWWTATHWAASWRAHVWWAIRRGHWSSVSWVEHWMAHRRMWWVHHCVRVSKGVKTNSWRSSGIEVSWVDLGAVCGSLPFGRNLTISFVVLSAVRITTGSGSCTIWLPRSGSWRDWIWQWLAVEDWRMGKSTEHWMDWHAVW